MSKKTQNRQARIKLRSRIPFPPTRVFTDRKKQSNKTQCRGKRDLLSPYFYLSMSTFGASGSTATCGGMMAPSLSMRNLPRFQLWLSPSVGSPLFVRGLTSHILSWTILASYSGCKTIMAEVISSSLWENNESRISRLPDRAAQRHT